MLIFTLKQMYMPKSTNLCLILAAGLIIVLSVTFPIILINISADLLLPFLPSTLFFVNFLLKAMIGRSVLYYYIVYNIYDYILPPT